MTLQTLAIMMTGVMLGSRNGALAVLMYLAEATFPKLPVLASGKMNMLALFGPNGGYLIGSYSKPILWAGLPKKTFPEQNNRDAGNLHLACAIELAVGTLWLGQFIGFKYVVAMGILPFIAGEAVKTIAS